MTTRSITSQLAPTIRKVADSIIKLEGRLETDEKEFDELSKQVIEKGFKIKSVLHFSGQNCN